MKVAPYFCKPAPLKKTGRWRKGERQEQEHNQRGKRRVKKKGVGKKTWIRETICGDGEEGLATATLSYIKICVGHCSSGLLFLSLSIFPLSPVLGVQLTEALLWGGGEGIQGWEEGRREGCFILSSLSLWCQQNKNTNPTTLVCVCVCVCVKYQ